MMKPDIFKALIFLAVTTLLNPAFAENSRPQFIRVACVGDSITYGGGAGSFWNYPGQLQKILGKGYTVENFGHNGATMLKQGDSPYWNQEVFKGAQTFLPDIVIIKLGTNDTKPRNWAFKGSFESDATEMVKLFQNLPSKPKVYLCYPVPAFPGQWGIRDKVIKEEVVPLVAKVAASTGANIIDLYQALGNKPELFPDTVHPNVLGHRLMADTVAESITGNKTAAYDLADVQLLYEYRKFPALGTQFRDNAVFQAGKPIVIWGSTRLLDKPEDGEVVIHLTFDAINRTIAVKPEMAEWQVVLPAMKASSEPHTLEVKVTLDGKLIHERALAGIVFGDVFYVADAGGTLAVPKVKPSGQIVRVMERKCKRSYSQTPSRFSISASPLTKTRFSSCWEDVSPDRLSDLGHTIAARTGSPVGIIYMSGAEAGEIKNWMPHTALSPGDKGSPTRSHSYNVMTHPFMPATLRGLIFLAGPSTVELTQGATFGPEMSALANSWKKGFASAEGEDVPFIYTVPNAKAAPKLTKPTDIEGKSVAIEEGTRIPIETFMDGIGE